MSWECNYCKRVYPFHYLAAFCHLAGCRKVPS
jgi:hypothetical protein